jgi:hypothetical protein
MKKVLFAAAIAATAGVAFVGQGQAAPAKDPMCTMAGQSTNQNWADHYKCWQGPAVKVAAPKPNKEPMCNLPAAANSQSWAQQYHCWDGPVVKVAAPPPSHKDPMCSMGVQSTNQGWADHYHCWAK